VLKYQTSVEESYICYPVCKLFICSRFTAIKVAKRTRMAVKVCHWVKHLKVFILYTSICLMKVDVCNGNLFHIL